MYPTIAFKCVCTLSFGRKQQMNDSFSGKMLRVRNFIIVVIIAIVCNGTDKKLIKNRNVVVVKIYNLVHPTKEFCYTFIFHPNSVYSTKNLASFYRVFLIIIVRNGFGEISG